MDFQRIKDDNYLEGLSSIICAFKNHYLFGLEGELRWPYKCEDSLSILQRYGVCFTSTDDLINYFIQEITPESEDDCLWLRLTIPTFNSASQSFEYDFSNLANEVYYNRKNIKIQEWPISVVITSALFHLIICNLSFTEDLFNRGRTSNPLAILVLSKYPVCFAPPISWASIFQLCINPVIGPVLVPALKELPLLNKLTIVSTFIIPSFNHYSTSIPSNKSFFKSGMIGFLSLLNIDEQIALNLVKKVEKANDGEPLKIFLKNYKLGLDQIIKLEENYDDTETKKVG